MKYTGQKVIFDQSQLIDVGYATVKTQIVDDNAPAIDLHFKLRQGKDKQWKVYDIVAEGISLLSAKQKEVLQMFEVCCTFDKINRCRRWRKCFIQFALQIAYILASEFAAK